MIQQRKLFKDLNLSNAFLFAAALEDKETCQLVLELILGIKVKLAHVKAENSILYSSDIRTVRLDIYAEDEAYVGYNVEMQNADDKNLAKRSRFHQAEMDVSSLKPGQDFNDLKPSFIVFICTFDPFEEKLYRYTFEERCLETNMPLGDETKKIFLNTKGSNPADVPEELVWFLSYVETSTGEVAEQSSNPMVWELHDRIKRLKQSREWEARYVKVEDLIRRECEESLREGLEIGEKKGEQKGEQNERKMLLNLISLMAKDNRGDEIVNLSSDSNFLEEMRVYYHL